MRVSKWAPSWTRDGSLKRAVEELREHFPPIVPVRVFKRSLPSGEFGWTIPHTDSKGHIRRFSILLADHMGWEFTYSTLLHEWAHVIAWRQGDTAEDHSPEWGLAYARIYQELVDV